MELTDELKKGRRLALGIEGLEVLENFSWDPATHRWELPFQLTGGYEPTEWVPAVTRWYALISPQYPFGKLDIFPAADGGITRTFHHQQHNSWDGISNWRDGNICAATTLGRWGRKYFNKEPYEAEARLRWNILRSMEWVQAAAEGTLVQAGELFEIPSFPQCKDRLFAYDESPATFREWQRLLTGFRTGTVYSRQGLEESRIFGLTKFSMGSGSLRVPWGNWIGDSDSDDFEDLWVMLPEIPIIDPWEIPGTWEQLWQRASAQGVELKKIVYQRLVKPKGGRPLFLFLGFPVPERVGGENVRIWWFACGLPKMLPITKGFTPGSVAEYDHQFKVSFGRSPEINWYWTENWNKEDISGRGRLPEPVTDRRIVLVGAGAVGSCLAESLIRLGCSRLTVIDADTLVIGNLVRHTLSLDDIGKPKVEGLEKRLNKVSPHASVKGINQELGGPDGEVGVEDYLENTDIVIDATGSDTTIDILAKSLSGTDKLFISVSTGVGAKRLFCFMQAMRSLPFEPTAFHARLAPWLEKERAEDPEPEFPMDGIGCWHPVFPARWDDISMLVSAAVRPMEKFISDVNSKQQLMVIERQLDSSGAFQGLQVHFDH
jgi:hypothetical protein